MAVFPKRPNGQFRLKRILSDYAEHCKILEQFFEERIQSSFNQHLALCNQRNDYDTFWAFSAFLAEDATEGHQQRGCSRKIGDITAWILQKYLPQEGNATVHNYLDRYIGNEKVGEKDERCLQSVGCTLGAGKVKRQVVESLGDKKSQETAGTVTTLTPDMLQDAAPQVTEKTLSPLLAEIVQYEALRAFHRQIVTCNERLGAAGQMPEMVQQLSTAFTALCGRLDQSRFRPVAAFLDACRRLFQKLTGRLSSVSAVSLWGARAHLNGMYQSQRGVDSTCRGLAAGAA